ncbi:MAG TPA: NAD(P)H-binding protein, partial [Solirubrobacteraceae bacterium]|nr:NAD(P)H-binding protein [Solirubrobacteraceae bacterium]
MLLLTGATGLIGSALLRRLLEADRPVRALVRDPRRLGDQRVRVQIALGDLADPQSLRNALRGVDAVVHLAATIRDQPRGSIEELDGIATWRLVQAAERAGVGRFVFFSALNATSHNRARFLRAKALAEQAVAESGVPHTIFAPSIVYAPGDAFLSILARMSLLPVMPVSGRGQARFQPIWAQDVASCVMAVLERDASAARERYELAGPDTLTYDELVGLALRSFGRGGRRVVHVPSPIVRRSLRAVQALMRSRAPATWDEAELLEVSMLAAQGTADALELGVTPRAMADVLGVARPAPRAA